MKIECCQRTGSADIVDPRQATQGCQDQRYRLDLFERGNRTQIKLEHAPEDVGVGGAGNHLQVHIVVEIGVRVT